MDNFPLYYYYYNYYIDIIDFMDLFDFYEGVRVWVGGHFNMLRYGDVPPPSFSLNLSEHTISLKYIPWKSWKWGKVYPENLMSATKTKERKYFGYLSLKSYTLSEHRGVGCWKTIPWENTLVQKHILRGRHIPVPQHIEVPLPSDSP